MSPRSRAQQRHWNDGYAVGYRAAHTVLQRELRAEYDARLRVHGSITALVRHWLQRRIQRATRRP
jgi:hypothetical protein